MPRRVQLALGLSLLVVACAGLLVLVRAFDASFSTRAVQVRHAGSVKWERRAGGPDALPLGRFVLPRPGALRVVACPALAREPHATLRVTDSTGRRVANEPLTPDEARGRRCFDASFHSDRAGVYTAELTVPAGASAHSIKRAEAFASRRITFVSAWPVLTLLLGLVLAATARRREAPRGEHDDATPPVVTPAAPASASVPGIPEGWVGGIMPPSMLTPGAATPAFVAPGVQADTAHAPYRPPPAPEGPADARPIVERPYAWLFALLAYVAVHIAMAVVVTAYVVAHGGGAAATETGQFVAFTLLVQHTMLIGVAAWFMGAFRGYDVRKALGVVPVTPAQLAVALGAGVGLIAVAVASTKLIHDVSAAPIAQMIERTPARLAIGFGALLAPFSEELFFRGVLVRAFGKKSVVVGVVASTAIFTAAHALQLWGAWAGLIPICSVALVNGWLRVKSGGITQPWIVHTLYNGALSAGLYFGT